MGTTLGRSEQINTATQINNKQPYPPTMPNLLASKKSFSRSLSKKWNSVLTGGGGGLGGGSKHDNNRKKYGAKVISLDRSDEEEVPSTVKGGPPPVQQVSDTSSDESEGEDEAEDAAAKYGYGEAAPSSEVTSDAATPMPRRLSTRASVGFGNGGARNTSRRASIQRQTPLHFDDEDDNGADDGNLPFHPRRMPRRSSMKNSACPLRVSRRASIGTPHELQQRRLSMEAELAIGAIDATQIYEIQMPNQCRRESIKRRRSIQFNEEVNVRSIQAVSHVPGAIKHELWFQEAEYSTIKKKTRALLEKVDQNGIVNGKKYCTRGLEKYMEQKAGARSQTRYAAWDTVLMEQELQRQLHIFDEVSIGQQYAVTSTMNAAEAARRATCDADEVAGYYTTTTAAAPTVSAPVDFPTTSRPSPPVPQHVVSDNEEDDPTNTGPPQQPQRGIAFRRTPRRASIA